MGARAKPALDHAIALASDQSEDYTRQGRALDLVEALVLTVPVPLPTFARVPETAPRCAHTLPPQPRGHKARGRDRTRGLFHLRLASALGWRSASC